MSIIDNLDTLNDAQLSEVFAVEVAFPGAYVIGQFTFATSADAVLPFLGKAFGWFAEQVIAGVTVRVSHRGKQTKENPLAHCHAFATAPTFARAACIALLRAKRAENGGAK